jgi:uncharacterized protein YcbX
MSTSTVTGLATAAVKGTRLREVESVTLGSSGAEGDRRFFLVDERGRLINAMLLGELQQIVASFHEPSGRLTLEFPDGAVVEDVVELGASVATRRGSNEFRPAHEVAGPWASALSAWADRPVRLMHTESAIDRGTKGAASLISRASLERLAQEAGVDGVDGRRFRMLIEIDGVAAHAEDDWVGRSIRLGESVIHFEGHVGRCKITTLNPERGKADLPTLDVLRRYRGELPSIEPIPFGIFGRVLQGGTVRVGDSVTPNE